MKRFRLLPCFALVLVVFMGDDCDSHTGSDTEQSKQQEKILAEGTAQVGMPGIKNFREKKLLKDIYEMRDQDGLLTYTYVFAEQTGKLVFLCDSIGYPLPYATQFTNPQKADRYYEHGYLVLPQADPNGLFSPASAEGTWIVCRDPGAKTARVVYVEPRVISSPFKLVAE